MRGLSIFALVLFLSAQAFADALIDPALALFAQQKGSGQRAQVLALMEIPNVRVPEPPRYHAPAVLTYLRTLTRISYDSLPIELKTRAHREIEMREMFWINLSFSATVTPEGLLELSKMGSIKKIYAIRQVNYPQFHFSGFATQQDWPYNAVDVGLDRVAREMGHIDGRGVLIGHIDTGVDGKHPAVGSKVIAFFNGQKLGVPTDSQSHGTHTAGTLVGGDRSTDLIGMAPAAKLISAGFLRQYDEILRGMQWILDPDGNPQTNDMPRLVSNSWNSEGAPDLELFYRAISSWEAAGVLPVFSAGNAGPRPRSITKPHEHPDVLAIAATGPDGKVAGFSSRGPGVFKGQETQKPDISAPGVEINSTVPGGKYGKFSGTSMACPHAAGAAALVLQANPSLNPAQVRELLRATSIPVDANGQTIPQRAWNPSYGFGKLSVYNAVKTALRLGRGGQLEAFFNFFVRKTPKDETVRFSLNEISKTFNETKWD